MKKFPIEQLKFWFLNSRRPLPWREAITPYRIWISEIMLQQTQVSVVIPYFDRWMEAFPTVEHLAGSSLEKVMKCWEGLGYYSRARNLLKGAQYIVEKHQGKIPSQKEQLIQIPGIGSYTAGAILSFAFHQKAAAVDGNVLRVLSRFLGYQESIDRPKSKKELEIYAVSILPNCEPWLISEALIELGAMVCMKKATCTHCPLKSECFAYQNKLQSHLPKKEKQPKIIHLIRQVAVIRHGTRYLIEKREEGGLMQDLYEYPYYNCNLAEPEYLKMEFEKRLGLQLHYLKPLNRQRHTFTCYKADLFPHLFEVGESSNRFLWKNLEELLKLPLSSGHKKVLTELISQEV